MVVGVGGVGSVTAEMLTRCGIAKVKKLCAVECESFGVAVGVYFVFIFYVIFFAVDSVRLR